MLVIDDSVADRPDHQGACVDGTAVLREPFGYQRGAFQEREFQGLGGTRLVRANIREIAANCGTTQQSAAKRLDATDQERKDAEKKIDAELHMVGLDHFSETIAQRMTVLELLAARFNNDSRAIRRVCLEVMDRMASMLEPELRFTLDAESKRDMSIAAYVHDIGKSGPFDASQESQEATVKLYAVENVSDPEQTIAQTVHTGFSSAEAKSMLEHLGACGMHSTDTMRAFWDRHGYWTHDILEADSEDIPSRARVVAGSHHLDRGIDPYGFVSGDYVTMLQNRVLMAVDKYQAAVARGRKCHAAAMDVIARILSPKYERDVIMNRVLKVLDALGKTETLFEEAA